VAITYSGLMEADFDALQAVGGAWKTLADTIDSEAGTIEDLRRADDAKLGINNWDGDTAEIGRERVRDIVLPLDERAAGARRTSIAILDAVEELKSCQTELNDLVAETPARGVTVDGDGVVTTPYTVSTQQQQQVLVVQSEINALLERATEADEALKAAIGIWAETFSESERLDLIHQAADEAGELQELIDSGATPEQINEWWNGLSEAERLGILEGSPELIGDVDGIPTEFRDSANRDLLETELGRFDPMLDEEIADVEALIAEMEANGDHQTVTTRDDPVHGTITSTSPTQEYLDLVAQLEELQGQRDDRDALTSLQDGISGQASSGQDYYLLGYGADTDDGRAIVSVGNPDTATNTGVFVPGTYAGLDNFAEPGGALDRAERMAEDANRWGVPGEETAMIAWLDYDVPESASPGEDWADEGMAGIIPEAGVDEAAKDGAVTLNHFVDGLNSTNENGEDSNTTLIAHSYGTRLIGEAVQLPDHGADQIVAVASPGLGVSHVSQLELPADKVWVTTAEGDAIEAVPDWNVTHGVDPTDQSVELDIPGEDGGQYEGFGAQVFESEAMGGSGSEIHGGYWDAENDARQNIAYIVTGQTGRVDRVEGG
jgi:hypothetical protein